MKYINSTRDQPIGIVRTVGENTLNDRMYQVTCATDQISLVGFGTTNLMGEIDVEMTPDTPTNRIEPNTIGALLRDAICLP